MAKAVHVSRCWRNERAKLTIDALQSDDGPLPAAAGLTTS